MKSLRLAVMLVTLCLFYVLVFAQVTSPSDLNTSTFIRDGSCSMDEKEYYCVAVKQQNQVYLLYLSQGKDPQILYIVQVLNLKHFLKGEVLQVEDMKMVWSYERST